MSVTVSHVTTRVRGGTIGITAAALLLLAGLLGCTQKERVYQMGEKVQVGGMVYSVLETEWTSELDPGGALARTPQHRFVLVHLSLNNAGNKEVTLPLLQLVDASGAEHLELPEGQGVPEWLGILRTLNPTETKDGRVLFDVPPGTYSLRLTDGGNQESERTALVALPPASKQGNLESPLLNQPTKQ